MEKKETDDPTPARHRKAGLKFAPKVLPKKDPKINLKTEPHEENKDVTIDKELMAKLRSLKSTDAPGSGTKAEKQGTRIQVAFGQADPSMPRTFPTPRSSGASTVKLPKKHNEPWDYTSTNYPITLPLRRPYSGDPEIPDGEEFGHSSCRTQDGKLTAAEELDQMERIDTPQLLFFQFPTSLPLPRQPGPVAETDTNTNVGANTKGNNRKRSHDKIHGCNLKELPGGHMGKILVYKSGKVKMTLGDVLFDVSAGADCMFAQEVVAMDAKEKHFCSIGEIPKRAIVTPDFDSLLGSMEKME